MVEPSFRRSSLLVPVAVNVSAVQFRNLNFCAQVGTGILAGAILTLVLNRVLAGWEAESSRNPRLLLAAAGVLGLLAAVACALPAWRAAASNPMRAIRYG